MFEQKNTKQGEQKTLSSLIESREVDAKPLSAYDTLVEAIRRSHPEKLSERESHTIARRLMGFCEHVMRVHDRLEREKQQNQLDKEGVHGNVTDKKRGE